MNVGFNGEKGLARTPPLLTPWCKQEVPVSGKSRSDNRQKNTLAGRFILTTTPTRATTQFVNPYDHTKPRLMAKPCRCLAVNKWQLGVLK